MSYGSFGYERGDGVAMPPNGCGHPKGECVCKPQPFKTLTQLVREAEADVSEEDLKGSGLTMEQWQKIRQWPEDG